MSCAEFAERLDAWMSGALSDAEARSVEQHAAECEACAERLESAGQVGPAAAEIAPPPGLREATLEAVARRRTLRRWRRAAGSIAAVAAIALLMLIARPAQKSASDFPGAGTVLLIQDRARPELAALDAAEREVETALRTQPADTGLVETLARIRRQRAALQEIVAQVRL